MPEIFLKPAEESCSQFFLDQHMITNICNKRPVDEICHLYRNLMTAFGKTLELVAAILVSVGLVNAGGGVSFTGAFSDPVRVILAIIFANIIPLVVFIICFIVGMFLENGENPERPAPVRGICVFVFWMSWVAAGMGILILLVLISADAIAIGFMIWAAVVVLSIFIWQPLVITILYVFRSNLGKDRGDDKENTYLPPGYSPACVWSMVAAACLVVALAFTITALASDNKGWVENELGVVTVGPYEYTFTEKFGWLDGGDVSVSGENTEDSSEDVEIPKEIEKQIDQNRKSSYEDTFNDAGLGAGICFIAACVSGFLALVCSFLAGMGIGYQATKPAGAGLSVINFLILTLGWAIWLGMTQSDRDDLSSDLDYALPFTIMASILSLFAAILCVIGMIMFKSPE